jgi:hypothetical protein
VLAKDESADGYVVLAIDEDRGRDGCARPTERSHAAAAALAPPKVAHQTPVSASRAAARPDAQPRTAPPT